MRGKRDTAIVTVHFDKQDPRTVVTTLKTPVDVAYRKEGRKWYAVALQFDLVGSASSKPKALQALKEMVNEYLSDCLDEKGPVEFFFPSEPKEWNNVDKQSFWLTVITEYNGKRPQPSLPLFSDFSDLRRSKRRVQSVDLLPTGLAVA